MERYLRPTSIIGASPSYLNVREVDPSKSISVSLSNISCEGLCPALFHLKPLQNYVNFTVSGVKYARWVDRWECSHWIIATTPATTYPGSEDLQMDLRISDWTVKGKKVTTQNTATLGQFHINEAYAGQWLIS